MAPLASYPDDRRRPRALEASTLCEAFQITAADYADHPALCLRGDAKMWTWREVADVVRRRSAAFAALGVGRGDAIGFMLVNRPALALFDIAAVHVGACGYSLYNTFPVEDIEHVVRDAGSRVLITERQFLERILEVRSRVASLEHIVVVDHAAAGTWSVAEFEAAGTSGAREGPSRQSVQPDDVLGLIYTSGTTGRPIGVQITHGNMMAQLRALADVVPVSPGGRIISFLPAAHAADRWSCLYSPMAYGHTVCYCPDPAALLEYAREVRPTILGGVPRIWEKVKDALESQLAADPDARRRAVTEAALELGLRRARAKQAGSVPAELELAWREADAQVFRSIRARLGVDECEWFAVGGAPTPPEVALFFDAIGIELAELWGMSETSAVTTVNPPGQIRIGTVGRALPGLELRTASDGEVLVRGPTVMAGYRNRPDRTAEVLGPDGWLATGDLGTVDAGGYLRIIGRKKELIINAAGKNMSPTKIEARVKEACPLAGQVVAIGDRRRYVVALVTLDPDGCAGFAAAHQLPDSSPEALMAEPLLHEAVEAQIGAANTQLARVEQVKRFAFVGRSWLPGGDELTPTMKLKRDSIALKYAREIDALYEPASVSHGRA